MNNGHHQHGHPEAEAEKHERLSKAVKESTEALAEFEKKIKTMDDAARRQLGSCWEHDHRKAEAKQRFKHFLALFGIAAAWALFLQCMAGCLADKISRIEESASPKFSIIMNPETVSAIGRHGTIVICCFMLCSIVLPAILLILYVRRDRE